MRVFILITLLAARGLAADFIDVTVDGRSYTNAEVVSKNPSELVIQSGASLRRVRLETLSENLRIRFGYDASRSAAWDSLVAAREAMRQQATAAERQAARIEAAKQESARRLAASAMLIDGKVSQRIDAGLLIWSGREIDRKSKDILRELGARNLDRSPDEKNTIYYAPCLLVDHPKQSKLSDGDPISVKAYPRGTYSYKTVSGGSKTVRIFTCAPSSVTTIPTDDEMRTIRMVYDY